MFTIIWPERRTVSDDQIKIWYADALVNGDADLETDDVTVMARELHDIGTITLGRD
jgi:hypothetical protein